jgi:nicotinamidase-related amidase
VILIDIQREYLDGALPLPGVEAAAGEAARLVARARREGVPVIHVVHAGPRGGRLFDPEGRSFEELEQIAARPGETVIRKSWPNAFAGTALAEVLQREGRRALVLAGCMTHICVSTTARAAHELGFQTTVVADACATRDLPDPLGGVIPAERVHRAALAELADGFATVVASAVAIL